MPTEPPFLIWERKEIDGLIYDETRTKNFTITLEARPSYCDRGNFLAKIFEHHPQETSLDSADAWPRYFMDEHRARLEIRDWLMKRKEI